MAAAVASLAAIVVGLSGVSDLCWTDRALPVGLAALTFVVSWRLVHTSFALHYAHAH